MRVPDFEFELPAELIAQTAAPRGDSRLLTLDRATGAVDHRRFAELPALLRSGDLLVFNNTRVFAARLLGHRVPSGGAVECLLLERVGTPVSAVEAPAAHVEPGERWMALMHPGQKLKPGARVRFGDGAAVLSGEVLDRHFQGRRTIRLWTDDGASVMVARR